MKLFERVRQELLALGFDFVEDKSYFEDGNDQFEAIKEGVSYYFSEYWQDFVLDGPNELHWSTDEQIGRICFNCADMPGKGKWIIEFPKPEV